MEEITQAFAATAMLAKIAKSALATDKQVKINEVAIELQGIIVDLQGRLAAIQQSYSDLSRVKDEAEQKLVEYQNWEDERSRYQLWKHPSGLLVYRLNPSDQSTKPDHWLCADCFEKRMKRYLQITGEGEFRVACKSCGFDFFFDGPISMAISQ